MKWLSEISCRQRYDDFLADPANQSGLKALYGEVEESGLVVWEHEPDLRRLSNAYYALDTEPARAVEELQALAEAGSQMSMLYLGQLCAQGHGTAVDLAQAAAWCRRAHDAGSPFPLRRLGHVLEKMEDFAGALEAFSTGFAVGDRLSGYYLGRLYMLAPEPYRDREKARALLSQAASQGNLLANRDLAHLLMRGHFGALDSVRGAWMLLVGTVKTVARLNSAPEALTNNELAVVSQQVWPC